MEITKVSIALDVLEGRDAVQKDFERLEKWTGRNLKISKAKCKVPALEETPVFYRLGMNERA